MKRVARTLLCIGIGFQSLTLAGPELPSLGDRASSIVSLQQEHDLGRLWLRQLRSQVTTIDHPLATTFLHDVIYRLVPHSEVTLSDFEFVIIDSRELNAFAVPGGIIGINYGLLLHARDEDELSAVLAHELAHISQRHFARRLEQAERQQPIAIATLLASILLIASNNAEAGFAGLVGSQAASIQNQLAYSRDWEREADRIGMRTLVNAGLDPSAMSSMFQQMLLASRYSQRPPEFLLTHPMTEGRIADAADRAESRYQRQRTRSFEFVLLQTDARLRYQINPDAQQHHLEEQLNIHDQPSVDQAALLFQLAAYHAQQGHAEAALEVLMRIPEPWQYHAIVTTLHTQQLDAMGHHARAEKRLQHGLSLHPDNLALHLLHAQRLRASDAPLATALLRKLCHQYPTNPMLWRELAETAHIAQQKALSHRAQAEQLFLNGRHALALRQMEVALAEAQRADDFQQMSIIRTRLQVLSNSPTQLR